MNSNKITATATATASAALMLEVLRPCPVAVARPAIKPAEYAPGTPAAAAIALAAEALGDLYWSGLSRTRYDSPDAFFTGCADTYVGTSVAAEAIEDATEASIVLALFRRTGLQDTRIRPTTAQAQARMLDYAAATAKHLKFLFAKQQDLALAA